jgi:hypothetical protein
VSQVVHDLIRVGDLDDLPFRGHKHRFLAAVARDSGRVWQRATAMTCSEEASPGRTVRIQEPQNPVARPDYRALMADQADCGTQGCLTGWNPGLSSANGKEHKPDSASPSHRGLVHYWRVWNLKIVMLA